MSKLIEDANALHESLQRSANAAKGIAPALASSGSAGTPQAPVVTPEMVGTALVQLMRGTTSLAVQIAVLVSNLAQKNPQRAA